MTKEEKGAVKWLLNFLTFNLKEMSDTDIVKTELDYLTHTRHLLDGCLDGINVKESRTKLKAYQKEGLYIIKDIFDNMKSTSGRLNIGFIIQPYVIEHDNECRIGIAIEGDDGVLARFRYEVVEILKPINLLDIRRCEREDCSSYFYKATKKEKRYCSNKCAWIINSRERRAGDKE